MKILAAIVTHNRCKLLERCINHLQTQTRLPDLILVVNNGSTDATVDMLMRRNIQYITQENLGSAGGWNRCISYALEHHFDAVWLMDDDGFPNPSALERLESNLDTGTTCVSSVVLRENDRKRLVFPFPVLDAFSAAAFLCLLSRRLALLHRRLGTRHRRRRGRWGGAPPGLAETSRCPGARRLHGHLVLDGDAGQGPRP